MRMKTPHRTTLLWTLKEVEKPDQIQPSRDSLETEQGLCYANIVCYMWEESEDAQQLANLQLPFCKVISSHSAYGELDFLC